MNMAIAQGSDPWRTIAVYASESELSKGNWMEHRWGPRRPCRARISVSTNGGVTGLGRLRDISMSGAFVETELSLPMFAQLAVTVLRDDGSEHPLDFPAVVVRQDTGGVGIEWCDPNPGFICRTLGCGIDCGYAAAAQMSANQVE